MTDQRVHPDADRWGGWTWQEPCRGEHFRRCSFCGSVHPEDLAAEPAWPGGANWADMKYGWPHKFYVDIPNRDLARLYVVSSTNQPGDGYLGLADLTAEQREAVERDGYTDRPALFFRFGTRPRHFGKFYSIHLADADLPAEVKATIERRSGLAFEFTPDGRVSWRPAGS